MNENTKMIISLANGVRSSSDIAEIVGLSRRYVRKVMLNKNLSRLSKGARVGQYNNQYVCGRRIDSSGYALVTAPIEHPYARQRTDRKGKLIYEHRLIMEEKLGRYLLPTEVVDHIDGLTLHNSPDNLRIFASNGEHLRATRAGKKPNWSVLGLCRMTSTRVQLEASEPVDMSRLRKEQGDSRLQQILRLALQLGTDSRFLSGTSYHTKKVGIDMSCRSTIELALVGLYRKYA